MTFTKTTLTMAFLSAFATFYTLALWAGLDSHLNFFPSTEWRRIAIVPALVVGLFSGVFTAPFYAQIFKSQEVREAELYKKETVKVKNNFNLFICTLIFSYCFYTFFLFGIGPLATYFNFTTVEKDISGAKVYLGGRSPCYFIKTDDLQENVYITYSEFNSIPAGMVRMHIVFKKSSFGMTIAHYNFLLNNN